MSPTLAAPPSDTVCSPKRTAVGSAKPTGIPLLRTGQDGHPYAIPPAVTEPYRTPIPATTDDENPTPRISERGSAADTLQRQPPMPQRRGVCQRQGFTTEGREKPVVNLEIRGC